MRGDDERHVGILPAQYRHRPAHPPDRLAPVLPPVRGHDDQRSGILFDFPEFGESAVARIPARGDDGVDHGVPRHHDPVGRHPLGAQVPAGGPGGRQVESAQLGDHPAVGLLRERAARVAGTQPRLHVHDRNFGEEGGHRPGQGGRGVSLDEHRVHVGRAQPAPEAAEQAGGQLGDRACTGCAARTGGWVQFDLDLGAQTEAGKGVPYHRAVLAGGEHGRLGPPRALQFPDDRGEFDGFGAGTHDNGDALAAAQFRVVSVAGTGERIRRIETPFIASVYDRFT